VRGADHSSRGVLPTVVCRCVLSRYLLDEEALARFRQQRHKRKYNIQVGVSLSLTHTHSHIHSHSLTQRHAFTRTHRQYGELRSLRYRNDRERSNDRNHIYHYYYHYLLLLSPLSKVFTVIHLKQTMFPGHTVLQLFCIYSLCYM